MAKSTEHTPDGAGVDSEPREKRFMKSALAILGETGRTDFTGTRDIVGESCCESKISVRLLTKIELLVCTEDEDWG